MATISSNANSTHSPRHSSDNNLNSPTQSRRATRILSSSPWTQIVRGETELIVAATATPSSSSTAVIEQVASAAVVASPAPEDEGTENGIGSNVGKRPVWNKPSNGAVETGPVMGADSWPALSDAARASSNKSASDSLKGLSDGSSPSSSSVSGSQGSGTVSSSSQKQVSNNANTNSTPNHATPATSSRQRSTKRNANSSFNGGLSHPPAPQGPVAEGPTNNPSPRDHTQRSGSVSQSHGGSDHPQQRNYRNRNGGQHPRGDGSHHHNYGGRRDQDRGNQDWNNHRHFNGRDAHVQQQRAVQRFMRHPPPPPPPTSAPFIAPQPIRPFGGPMAYTELATPMYYVAAPPPESLRGVPFVASIPHPIFVPAPDPPQLHSRIVNQIDYYFSNENLIKDTYLRQNMDDLGWVPIKLIAGFKKVLNLTDNIQLILDVLRSSTVVEVQGDKVRKRNDWMRWIMPPVQLPNVSATQAQGNSSHDMLAAHVQNVSLEQNSTDHNSTRSQAEAFLSRSSSGDLNNQSPLSSSSEGMGQVSSQGSSNRSISARSSN